MKFNPYTTTFLLLFNSSITQISKKSAIFLTERFINMFILMFKHRNCLKNKEMGKLIWNINPFRGSQNERYSRRWRNRCNHNKKVSMIHLIVSFVNILHEMNMLFRSTLIHFDECGYKNKLYTLQAPWWNLRDNLTFIHLQF